MNLLGRMCYSERNRIGEEDWRGRPGAVIRQRRLHADYSMSKRIHLTGTTIKNHVDGIRIFERRHDHSVSFVCGCFKFDADDTGMQSK